MNNSRYAAVIDVGSNTIRLLLFDAEDGHIKRIIADETITTRLGEGKERTGALAREACERTREGLRVFKSLIDREGVQRVYAFATSPLRGVDNADMFLNMFDEICNVTLTVLSGDDEARAIYAGVAGDGAIGDDDHHMVLDIGGGSTEIIEKRRGQDIEVISIPLGFLALEKIVSLEQALSELDIAVLMDNIHASLRSLLPHRDQVPKKLIGTGGSIWQLGDIDRARHNEPAEALHGWMLRATAMYEIITYLASLPLEERSKVPGLSPERACSVIAGGALAYNMMRYFGAEEIFISLRDIRYGVFELFHAGYLPRILPKQC